MFSLLFSFVGIMAIIEGDVIFGVIFIIIFGVGFSPMVYLFTKFLTKKIAKSMPLLNSETVNYFKIENNLIYIEQSNDMYMSTTKADFSFINKVCEDKENFYLYVSSQQAHLLPKADIFTGTAEELSEIFKNTLDKKYKKYR